MDIRLANTEDEIKKCFNLLSELRPHLTLSEFLSAVERMAISNNYQIAYLSSQGIKAVAGFRISEWLHSGRYLEIEELITVSEERSNGHGGKLFDWLCSHARENECNQVRLVSGVSRKEAHKFYVNKGMLFEAKYFSLSL